MKGCCACSSYSYIVFRHSAQNLLSSRLLSKNLMNKIYRTIILPVVLYGCETWSLTLWEERKPRAFENMVLRRIFGPRRDEVTGKRRRLHNEELNDLYASPNIVRVIKSRRMRWAGHVARMGEEYKSFSSSLCNLLHSPVTSSLLGPNIFLNTLFSNTLSFVSPCSVNDQVSHPYKTKGKITVLYILIFKFLDSILEDKRFCTE